MKLLAGHEFRKFGISYGLRCDELNTVQYLGHSEIMKFIWDSLETSMCFIADLFYLPNDTVSLLYLCANHSFTLEPGILATISRLRVNNVSCTS